MLFGVAEVAVEGLLGDVESPAHSRKDLAMNAYTKCSAVALFALTLTTACSGRTLPVGDHDDGGTGPVVDGSGPELPPPGNDAGPSFGSLAAPLDVMMMLSGVKS